jgi:anti-anti-sigma regulatory factor
MDGATVRIVDEGTATRVAVEGAMSIEWVGAIRDGLLQAFGAGKQVELSLAEVTEVDLAGLQLLCSAHRTALARNLGFRVTGGHNEPVATVARAAGLPRHAGCANDQFGSCVWKRNQ